MMIRALRIRFNSSIYKSARCCLRQRVRRQHSEIEWIMTILSWLSAVQNISLSKEEDNNKKNTTRESAKTNLLVAHFSLIDDHFFDWSFFFASKPLSLLLFSAAFVKNNLVCKLVSLVFSRFLCRRETHLTRRRRRRRRRKHRDSRRVLFESIVYTSVSYTHLTLPTILLV